MSQVTVADLRPVDLFDDLDDLPVEERNGQAVWMCDGNVWGQWGGKAPATAPEAGLARTVERVCVSHAGAVQEPARAALAVSSATTSVQ